MLVHVVDRNTQASARYESASTAVRVGRDPHSDLRLEGSRVSRNHALLMEEHGRLFIQSLGMNASYLVVTKGAQRERVRLPRAEKVALPPGAQVDIGHYSLFVDLEVVGGKERRDGAEELAALENRIHRKLMDALNLREVKSSRELGEELKKRIAKTLENLVDAEIPQIDEGLRRHILAEGLRSAIVLRILSAGSGTTQEEGHAGRLGRVVDEVVARFLQKIGASGAPDTMDEDLKRLEDGFLAAFHGFLEKAPASLSEQIVRAHLLRDLTNVVVGLGPLEDLTKIPSIQEIMVVDRDTIYVEKGKMERVPRAFLSDEVLMTVIERILAPIGRRIDTSTPMVDARLKDGSRVNAIIPPLAIRGPCLTIRKFGTVRLTVQALVSTGSLSPEAAEFLKACVVGRKNILVSGGTGSGKTTLLNVLSAFIPSDERIVTVEDSAELQLAQEHVVTLETKAPNVEGKGGYSIRDLVRNALRMRPDRILVGECRGAETLDMLQAMNTGHAGSMTTAHANTPHDCLLRLEVMAMQAATGITIQSLREQIAAALDLIVQVERAKDPETGQVRRQVTSITEVIGLDERDGTVRTFEILGRVGGRLAFTGYLPSFLDELVDNDLLDLDTMFARPEVSE